MLNMEEVGSAHFSENKEKRIMKKFIKFVAVIVIIVITFVAMGCEPDPNKKPLLPLNSISVGR